MRTLCLLIWLASCALTACQQQPSSIKGPHSHSTAPRPRRLQPIEHKRVSFPQYTGSRSPPSPRKPSKSKKHGVPPYAVQMEPLVQYSQPDPLYSIEKQYISEAKPAEAPSNALVKNAPSDVTEAESISRVGQITHARLRPPTHLSPPSPPRHHHHHHHHPPMRDVEFSSYGTYYEGPPEAFEAPEPIIEIIIKESNESLPAPPPLPTPPPPKKVKEPVQVFYVKYRKDPSGGYGGEEKVIYDPPVPAVTPAANTEDSHETHEEPQPVAYHDLEEASVAPPPSTTLKAIIRPDSETFHAQGGVHITFGRPEDSQDDHGDAQEPQFPPYGQHSAPEPAVAHAPKPLISRSSSGGTSTLTKRNPEPFNGQSFPHPSAPSTLQQTPQFPPQDFQPPPLSPTQYSTLPQNYQLVRPQAPTQRYTTINNPPPPLQPYQTINQQSPSNLPSTGFQPFTQSGAPLQGISPFQQPRTPTQEQHQQQVEKVNRLQQQQQQLQQQLAQQHRFHPFPQQQFQQSPPFSLQPSQQLFPQITQQPQANHANHNTQLSQPQFSQPQQLQQQPEPQQQQQQQQQQTLNQNYQQQTTQPQQATQQQHYQQQQPQYRPPPQLQYPTPGPDIVKSVEHSNHFQNHKSESTPSFLPTLRPQISTRTTSASQEYYRTSTRSTTTEDVTEVVTEDPKKVEADKKKKEAQQKKNIENLPDEVPDDLREQLLSSGILGNADIQILDYDKIGDIPIENLPPEALANFQQATAGSERILKVVRRPDPVEERDDADAASASSEQHAVSISHTSDSDMEMKVVRFDPEADHGVADRYMKNGATQLAPVVLNDSKYNRYLPLQVSGSQFPVPDVPELRGRNVTSVVVLAPVDYEFLKRREESTNDGRVGRSAAPVLEVQGVHFVAGDVLKALVHTPTVDNYRRWLDKENRTSPEKQSVVLLVVEPSPEHPEKEIYMYDIASGRVSKLRGELSSTFVKVAESNSQNQDLEEISDSSAATPPGGEFTVRTSAVQSRPSR